MGSAVGRGSQTFRFFSALRSKNFHTPTNQTLNPEPIFLRFGMKVTDDSIMDFLVNLRKSGAQNGFRV